MISDDMFVVNKLNVIVIYSRGTTHHSRIL